MKECDGVVLAAGLSTRMGQHKMTLPLGGKTVIEKSVEGMYEVVRRVLVVVGWQAERIQELLAMTYYHQYQVPTTVVRLTAVVGPGGKGGGRGWREIAENLHKGEKVQIPHFSPEELCHYVDIRDVARQQIAQAEHPKAVGEIFNCCATEPTRGTEFIEIVKKMYPGIEVDCGFAWSMAQGGEVSFDMKKAKKLLGYEPKYTLADAMQSIKDWIDAGGLQATASEGMTDHYGAGVKED